VESMSSHELAVTHHIRRVHKMFRSKILPTFNEGAYII